MQWEFASDLPTVRADPNLLRQALEQVLGNAVKFSGPSCVPYSDRTLARPRSGTDWPVRAGPRCWLQPGAAGGLFKVFGRLHSTQQFPGIGMGLAIARRIMERLGQVAITSPGVGLGATVTVGLPIQ